jgi:hypothetical protein
VSPNTINKPLIATPHTQKRESRPSAKHLLSSGDKAGMKYNYSEFIPPHGGKAPFMAWRLAVKSAMAKIHALTLCDDDEAAHPKGYTQQQQQCLLLHLIIIKRSRVG